MILSSLRALEEDIARQVKSGFKIKLAGPAGQKSIITFRKL